jgi:hypothetical protein
MALRPQPSHTIRRRPVEIGSRLGVPAIYPSGGLLARRLLPSTGSLGSVPPLPRYYSTLRIPTTHPAALRFLRTGGIPVASEFRSHGRRMRRPWAWSWSPGTSRRESAEKMEGPPRFLGNPKVNVPRSPTPAGSQAPGHGGTATRPSVSSTTSAPASFFISGLNRTARSLAVYASQRRLLGRHARLASGRWPSSAGRGSMPRRVPSRGFRDTIASSTPKLSWRTLG